MILRSLLIVATPYLHMWRLFFLLMYVCGVTHVCVWRDSFMWVTWVIHMHCTTYLWEWYETPFTHVTILFLTHATHINESLFNSCHPHEWVTMWVIWDSIYMRDIFFSSCLPHGWVTILVIWDTMGWLRWVGSIKLQVSFAEYSLFNRALLQNRPMT